jgi:hypothetical protein
VLATPPPDAGCCTPLLPEIAEEPTTPAVLLPYEVARPLFGLCFPTLKRNKLAHHIKNLKMERKRDIEL